MAQVLVVDDEAHIRQLLRIVLEEYGHQVDGAANGVAALDLNKEVPADVIITDILMPGMNGLDLIHEFPRGFPDARIIAVSGALNSDQEEDLFQASRMGAVRVFSKPFDLLEIAETVAILAGERGGASVAEKPDGKKFCNSPVSVTL